MPDDPTVDLSRLGHWPAEQAVIDWLGRLKANADSVGNPDLAVQCAAAQHVIATLVGHLYHSLRP